MENIQVKPTAAENTKTFVDFIGYNCHTAMSIEGVRQRPKPMLVLFPHTPVGKARAVAQAKAAALLMAQACAIEKIIHCNLRDIFVDQDVTKEIDASVIVKDAMYVLDFKNEELPPEQDRTNISIKLMQLIHTTPVVCIFLDDAALGGSLRPYGYNIDKCIFLSAGIFASSEGTSIACRSIVLPVLAEVDFATLQSETNVRHVTLSTTQVADSKEQDV